MNEPVILAIDNGTQSVRALLFDLAGNLLAKSQVMLTPYVDEHPGWAENDPAYYWKSLGEACQQLWQTTEIQPEEIIGVALTTQRGTVINVDKDGNHLRPAITWMDQRRCTPDMSRVNPLIRGALKLVGAASTFENLLAVAECNWLAQNQPEIHKDSHKFLFLSGYLTHKLVGKFVDSVGSQVGYVPFDYKNLEWAAAGDLKWKGLNIRRDQLPDLIPPGQKLGEITAEASALTGIPQGKALIAAAADKACEVLGSGGMTSNVGCLSYGTTATINITSDKYFERIRFLPSYPSAVPEMYNAEVQIYRGYWMVSWFKEQFGFREQLIAEEEGVIAESLFDDLVKDIPAGSLGLMLQPYWNPGVREPGPEAKGAIIGFGDAHTRGHVYRAILEGLAYALRDGKEQLERTRKITIDQLRVSGGGSQSDVAMQLTADIFNLPAARPHTFETSGLGAAINVAVGLGHHPDYATAVRKMTREGRVFTPNPEARDTYEQLYTRVYQRMYKQLKGLYKDIKDITGYPS
jgi:sugar (pentulose or hexulose) kinase